MPVPRFLVDAALTVVPKLAGGALTLGLGLALIGSFGPVEYGRYVFAVTLILLADAVIGTPFDLAVIRRVQARVATDAAMAVAVERTAFWLKLGLTGVLAALVAVTVGRAAGGLMPYVALAALSVMMLRSALLHLQLRQRFRAYGGIELAHLVFKNGPILALILTDAATPGRILLCLAVGPALAAVAALPLMRGLRLARPPFMAHFGAVGRLVFWYVPTLALGATLAQLDILMLGVMRPGAALGHYGAAAVAASLPGMLGMYLGVVLTPRVVSAAAAGTLRAPFLRIQAGLTVAALGLGGGAAALVASPLAARLPPEYAASLPVFATLLPGMLVAMTSSAMALPLVLVARKTFLLRLDMIVAPLALLAYWAVIPVWGIIGAAAVTLTVTLVRSLAVLAAGWQITAAAVLLD
jgi:O-antigen/teichoic acid export membrane protein